VVRDGFELRRPDQGEGHFQVERHPDAAKDQQGKLRVGAAVGSAKGRRAPAALIEAGDVFVVDTAHGHSQGCSPAAWIKPMPAPAK